MCGCLFGEKNTNSILDRSDEIYEAGDSDVESDEVFADTWVSRGDSDDFDDDNDNDRSEGDLLVADEFDDEEGADDVKCSMPLPRCVAALVSARYAIIVRLSLLASLHVRDIDRVRQLCDSIVWSSFCEKKHLAEEKGRLMCSIITEAEKNEVPDYFRVAIADLLEIR